MIMSIRDEINNCIWHKSQYVFKIEPLKDGSFIIWISDKLGEDPYNGNHKYNWTKAGVFTTIERAHEYINLCKLVEYEDWVFKQKNPEVIIR